MKTRILTQISMNRLLLIIWVLALSCGVQAAQAAVTTYNITTTWYEPQTHPRDSIFIGTFDYDDMTHAVTNLKGLLSESMTGTNASDMVWIPLNNQLANGDALHTYTWHDATLGGTFATTFFNTNSNTFWTGLGGDGWSPAAGVAVGGVYYGFPVVAANPGNAYVLIFVPDSLATTNSSTLNWSEGTRDDNGNVITPSTGDIALAHTSYADFRPLVGPNGIDGGGMMGAVGMTATSYDVYGAIGTMGGYPASQVITAAAVPTFTINAKAGSNGSITPSDDVIVDSGTDQTFTIAAGPGYIIQDVMVDGVSVGAVSSYTFTNVVASHNIYATFAAPVAKIFRTGIAYLTVQAAYNAAATGDEIRIIAGNVDGPLLADRANIVVTLSGGYNTGFGTVSGITIIQGAPLIQTTLTISKGTVKPRLIKLQ